MSIYKNVSFSEVHPLKDKLNILLVTATPTETKHLHKTMFNDKAPVLRVFKDNCTYYVGYLGLHLCVHVECGMGSVGFNASLITTTNAIELWNPKAVLMPGISFGMNSNNEKIGDILVSKTISSYNIKRVGADEQIYRSPIPPAGGVLLNRFTNLAKDWKFEDQSISPSVHFTNLLSGESLVDNLIYRENIAKAFPDSKGGEMEGAGIFTAANDKKIEWIVVKSICDFADGNKRENKKENQELAISTAVSLCNHIFSTPNSFDALGCIDTPADQQFYILDTPGSSAPKEVLFDIYKKEYERYYIEKELDSTFSKTIPFFSIWLHGDSGTGKTSIIRRYLDLYSKEYLYISLGCCNDMTELQILNYIYFEIAEKNNPNIEEIPNYSEPIVTKKICDEFKKWMKTNEGYLYIDEIPINEKQNHKRLLHSIVGILQNAKISSEEKVIKITASSIRNISIEDLSGSIAHLSENIKFFKVPKWSTDDIEKLINLISTELLGLDNIIKEKTTIRDNAKGSPRFIKNLVRHHIISPEKPIKDLIEEVKLELPGDK